MAINDTRGTKMTVVFLQLRGNDSFGAKQKSKRLKAFNILQSHPNYSAGHIVRILKITPWSVPSILA